MNHIPVRFVISELPDADIEALRNGETIISKMILTPDDYKLFQYNPGDIIEVETADGNRVSASIHDIEPIVDPIRVILIFTLKGKP